MPWFIATTVVQSQSWGITGWASNVTCKLALVMVLDGDELVDIKSFQVRVIQHCPDTTSSW